MFAFLTKHFYPMKKVFAIALIFALANTTGVYASGGDKDKKAKKNKSEKACCASKDAEAKSCAGKTEGKSEGKSCAGMEKKSCAGSKEKAL
jgi:hypothetical protein